MKINNITPYKTDYLQKNSINFTQKNNKNKSKNSKTLIGRDIGLSYWTAPSYQKQYMGIVENLTPEGQEEAKLAHQLAKKYVIYKDNHSKKGLITSDHHYIASLMLLLKFARDVEKGATTYETEANYILPRMICDMVSNTHLWQNESIKDVISVIEDEIRTSIRQLKEKSKPNGFITSIEIEENLMRNINILANNIASDYLRSSKNLNLDDSFALLAMQSGDRRTNTRTLNFCHNIDMVVSTRDDEKITNLSFYDVVSQKILKNLDRGYNVNVIYSNDDRKESKYLIANLLEQIKNTSPSEGYKNLNADNTDVVVINEKGNLYTALHEINKIDENDKRHHIFIIQNMGKNFLNSYSLDNNNQPILYANVLQQTIDTEKKNVHFIMMAKQDDYYSYGEVPSFESIFSKYQVLQLPIMDQKETKNALLDTKSEIEEKIGMKISQDALLTACELLSDEKGYKYNNTLKFIEHVASYYINEKEITKDHVLSYWENSKKINTKADDGSYEIIFDTKTGFDDIVGSPMVREQAELAVYEIKNFPKTKGYVIYNSDGAGGGRLNCAKAIAGEARIPMVIINAADFAIRDLDTVNNDPMSAIDTKIKKLFDIIKSQAQTNENKTIMLFISNFDNFGANPITGLSSIYEQQAFNRILKEMKRTKADKDYNLVVVGSSELPFYTNENIQRPGLFSDEIIIYPPRSRENIKDILIHQVNKKGYKLEGGVEDRSSNLIKHFSNLALDSNYVEIADIIDKANILAKKDNREEITIPDLNQAYLIKYLGMPSSLEVGEKQKEAITRHEGGHALNLQFMYDILKEKGDDLRIPDTASIITLDPRGDYLGCVMHNNSEENTVEENFETVFARMVCAFGGNSSEQTFYDLNGSWGISQDLKNANYWARVAVLDMGLGKNMGYYIPVMEKGTRIPRLTKEDEVNYTKDVKVLINNAKTLSDKIVECYKDFLVRFSDEHVKDFGTGNCVITGADFASALHEWEKNQPTQKKAEIYKLKKEAFEIMKASKNGEKYQVG